VDYDYRKINSFIVHRDDINEIFRHVLCISPQERLSIIGLEKGREDLIVAGLIIILAVMDRFNFSHFKVSDFGLLEGLALSVSQSAEMV
jgi:exopolyphosphatase/guanosine-5'-triphosphate,3'-diphosphate pyrophosphatase